MQRLSMIYLVLALLLYTSVVMFGAATSKHLGGILGATITNIVSLALPLAAVLPQLSRKTLTNNKFGVIMAACCGVSIGLFSIVILKAYAYNKVGVVAPVVFGGAIFLSTLLSTIIFKEKISAVEGVGLAVLAIGFGILIYARALAK